ncbi:hypothetical protein CASFOL_003100 [Castilleja foliolosa]|uniref:Peroxidase n=1 Tax=Castilleja foliolosa TaxID=1961234 RepID=A0ABD3EK29_9LAMI
MANYSLISFQVIITLALVFVCSSSAGQLSPVFYLKTCPKIFEIVEDEVRGAINYEERMGASLLRLHFHDCFVHGCDASILLDDTASFKSEKNALPNKNSIRGFEVIDKIKTKLEKQCPGVVSCADILALAAMISVKILVPDQKWCGWIVMFGRKDSITAYKNEADNGAIPSPASNLTQLIDLFSQNNLSKQDLVALSGGHTIGLVQCTNFRARIYNETNNIDGQFGAAARRECRVNTPGDDHKLQPLDIISPKEFDNSFFRDVRNNKTLLHSDQQLNTHDRDIAKWVYKYSDNQISFLEDFAKAMVRMGNIKPLLGPPGQIRKNCRMVN